MAQTVVGLFDDFADAQAVVQGLVNGGFARENISVVRSDVSGEYRQYTADTGADGAVAGAVGGATIGGLAGLLVGLGALTIPGVGPIIAAGPLAAALAGAGIGAATGGLLGALADLGLPEEEAGYYAEGVRRGGTLVSVVADEGMTDRAIDIMESYNPIDVQERAGLWRESGWTGYDANAAPYTEADLVEERSRYRTGTAATTGTRRARIYGARGYEDRDDGLANEAAGGAGGAVVGGLAGAAVGGPIGAVAGAAIGGAAGAEVADESETGDRLEDRREGRDIL